VLFSGGEKDDREERVLEKIRLHMENGAAGVMFGRNMWLRRPSEALALTRKVHAILGRYPR
jgi:fructose-bisphosphate aldolase, class I